MRKERESDLKRTVISYLDLHRFFWWRNNSGAIKLRNKKGVERFIRFGCPGSPDIYVLKDRLFGIELKAPYGEQSRSQIEFECGFRKAGGQYILARSIEDVITGLDIP